MSAPAALFPSLSGRVRRANLTFAPAVLRGLAGRCPNLPAYIVAVCPVVVPLALVVETQYTPALWLKMAIWLPVTAALALVLTHPVKGAVVAIQRDGKLHRFGQDSDAGGLPFATCFGTKGGAENDSIDSATRPPGIGP